VRNALGAVQSLLVLGGASDIGAAIAEQAQFEDDPAAAADLATANYAGPTSTLLHVAARLKDQGHGAIVVLSSVAGERIRKSNFVYGSTKAAIDGFAQGLGDSLAGSGVHVMVVRPGFVHTSMTEGKEPPPLATSAEVVADAVAEGLAAGKHVVWVPGTFRWVMAAFRHMPRGVWRKVSANL
jgi:decaprenylphospho-beta-D-erythro-pentofuranosid-2-ulose 2-reductase